MTIGTINSILDQLEELKTRFDPSVIPAIGKTVARLARQKFNDAEALVRYHELLLFLRAYPHNPRIVNLVDNELASFPRRVEALQASEVDLSTIETPEISGIAGTSVTDTFTYPIVRWLVGQQQGRVTLDWDWFEDEYRLAETWPRFMPLLEEDAAVEANVPYREWLSAAIGREKELPWLIKRFESLPGSEKRKAELYNSQKLYVRWTPAYESSRTGMRLAGPKIFYHRKPLIQRRDVSLPDELEKPPPALQLLSPSRGEAILDMAREASTVRYRELYGFTHGDPRRVFRAGLGRGVELLIAGVPPDWRLPLRAYHAAMIFKNGVAVGYFEGLSLFERMESGFNLYYTFRDGETAWLYARTLNVFRHLAGVTAFVLDPYQIGYENEEGIESGAFWFYRKLGFRPTKPEIMKLVLKEEERMASQPGYRTPARTLRKLATGPMIFELDKSKTGDWDGFQVRNIGLKAQQRMAEMYGGDAGRMRREAVASVARVLNVSARRWRDSGLNDFAMALALIPDLNRWTNPEKQDLGRIIEAKGNGEESEYLKLMQQHSRLRRAIIQLGSPPPIV
ncbi:MAG TPA: hypothetical protein VEW46_14365 [Pyrinomonadaceae bacterium]|nr:hypothetical protein [Pyrinomonadaceae bacterium]